MAATKLPEQVTHLLKHAKQLAREMELQACLLLVDRELDFKSVAKALGRVSLIVSSDEEGVLEKAKKAGLTVVPLHNEPETRHLQISQAMLEAIADDLLKAGDRIVAVYSGFERDNLDSVSVINLTEHLARLTSRDLQRLETQVPLEVLRSIVDLAVEIGQEGREGKKVGTLFVVGNHRKALSMSHEQVHDPFKGYGRKERSIRSPKVRESIKEIAQIDGAFIIGSDGIAYAAGRILDAPAEGLTLSKGLGARHWAAAAISKACNCIAIAVSESTGTVRIFQNGRVVLRIEPMDRGMKWSDFETEPPPADA
jgi:DNA integrity scanning protein DisA with diadenylate cyclase activity